MIPDEFMLAFNLIAFVVCAAAGRRKENYIVGFWWASGFLAKAIYFGMLVLDINPILADSVDVRTTLFRPIDVYLGVGILVFAVNGRLNNAVKDSIRWIRVHSPQSSTRHSQSSPH